MLMMLGIASQCLASVISQPLAPSVPHLCPFPRRLRRQRVPTRRRRSAAIDGAPFLPQHSDDAPFLSHRSNFAADVLLPRGGSDAFLSL